jgi:hypothetical protein
MGFRSFAAPRHQVTAAVATLSACVCAGVLEAMHVPELSESTAHAGTAAVALFAAALGARLFRTPRPVFVAIVGPPLIAAPAALVIGIVLAMVRGTGIGVGGLTIAKLGPGWPIALVILGLNIGLAGSALVATPVALVVRAAADLGRARHVLVLALWSIALGLAGCVAALPSSVRAWGAASLAVGGLALLAYLGERARTRAPSAAPPIGPYRS